MATLPPHKHHLGDAPHAGQTAAASTSATNPINNEHLKTHQLGDAPTGLAGIGSIKTDWLAGGEERFVPKGTQQQAAPVAPTNHIPDNGLD